LVYSNLGEYGGDRDFVVLSGGSAGGHLTALSALMPNNSDFKTGFEGVDCSVQAAVPIYGIYDFLDRTGALKDVGQAGMEKFVARVTMPGPKETHEAFWDIVSPISQVREDAPPFLIVHSRGDALAPFQGAEAFVEALSKVSRQEVIFAPLTRGQHAYDIANAPPTAAHVRLIERFLTKVYDARAKA
jgi:acetyl esterase/lipase